MELLLAFAKHFAVSGFSTSVHSHISISMDVCWGDKFMTSCLRAGNGVISWKIGYNTGSLLAL